MLVELVDLSVSSMLTWFTVSMNLNYIYNVCNWHDQCRNRIYWALIQGNEPLVCIRILTLLTEKLLYLKRKTYTYFLTCNASVEVWLFMHRPSDSETLFYSLVTCTNLFHTQGRFRLWIIFFTRSVLKDTCNSCVQ